MHIQIHVPAGDLGLDKGCITMGRRDKSYSISLHDQAYKVLTGMQAFGESKREAVKNGTDRDKIFSANTYKTYWKHTKYFLDWMKQNHPEVTTLKKARPFVKEWLQSRVEQVDKDGNHLSAWTIQTEAKALSKLYGIQPDDPDYFTPPKRNREDIKRSRSTTKRDRHFSETNNDELIKFCEGTGLRRSELSKLKGNDLMSVERIELAIKTFEAKEPSSYHQRLLDALYDTKMFEGTKYFLYVQGKGGRIRFSPIIGENEAAIVKRIQGTPKDEKVWQYVNSNADIHGYRAEYATAIYKQHARKIEDIPYDRVNKGTGKKFQSDVYTCRKDESGKKLDKKAMLVASKALGHNRICIVADNYIRGL